MSKSTVTILVVAVVVVAVIYFATPKAPSTRVTSANGNNQFLTGLGGLIGGTIAGAIRSTPGTAPSATSSTPPVYDPGWGYISGGANAPIDPTTGGVALGPGDTYGPPAPTS